MTKLITKQMTTRRVKQICKAHNVSVDRATYPDYAMPGYRLDGLLGDIQAAVRVVRAEEAGTSLVYTTYGNDGGVYLALVEL